MINSIPYSGPQPFSHKPKKKVKTLEERKAAFKKLIWETIGKNYKEFSKELLSEFFTHWTATKINGRVMGFEKEKTFDILARLRTWKRNKETNFGKIKPKAEEPKVYRPQKRKEGQLAGFEDLYNNEKFNLNR